MGNPGIGFEPNVLMLNQLFSIHYLLKKSIAVFFILLLAALTSCTVKTIITSLHQPQDNPTKASYRVDAFSNVVCAPAAKQDYIPSVQNWNVVKLFPVLLLFAGCSGIVLDLILESRFQQKRVLRQSLQPVFISIRSLRL